MRAKNSQSHKPLETDRKKKNRVKKIISLFQRYYPNAECALEHETPWQLLVATILSAQCTDERVNIVTRSLFKRFSSLNALADADLGDIEDEIRSTGFFRNKAKNIQASAKALVEHYGGRVPQDLEALVELPGIGRKTANVVLGNAFNIPTGVVVDTHVTRLSNRLGLVEGRNAVAIERRLNELVPKEHWIMFSHWLITHGRQVCKARTPRCNECFIEELCPKLI